MNDNDRLERLLDKYFKKIYKDEQTSDIKAAVDVMLAKCPLVRAAVRLLIAKAIDEAPPPTDVECP